MLRFTKKMALDARTDDWAKRRRRRIWLIRLGLVGLTVFVVAVFGWLLVSLGVVQEEALFKLVLLEWLPATSEETARNWINFLNRYFLFRYFAIGAIASIWLSIFSFSFTLIFRWNLSAWLHDRFFAEFDDYLLAPVRKPRAFDPLRGARANEKDVPLPWVEPDEGPRREAWRHLARFADLGPESAWRDRAARFGWMIIIGRSGSGKSRLAVEFARHLARRDRLGGGPRDGIGGRFRWRAEDACRRARLWWCFCVRRRFDWQADPWDAGWLRPGRLIGEQDELRWRQPATRPQAPEREAAYGAWRRRREFGAPAQEALKGWSPRKPTILLVDDPRPGDASKFVEHLIAGSSRWSHPVRLLIVNQSIPRDLRLKMEGKEWTSRLGGLSMDPLICSGVNWFTDRDLRPLWGEWARQSGHDVYPFTDQKRSDRFLRVTSGNPLLVELGFHYLRDGGLLDDLTREVLVTERVKRIFEALAAAGWDDLNHRRALAVATLAGGARGERGAELARSLALGESDSHVLRAMFPADDLESRHDIPPVRPDTIGDAFVLAVVESEEFPKDRDTLAAGIVAAAWRVDARETLRGALRLGAGDDPLRKCLAEGPPVDAGLDPVEVALAYAEVAMCVSRERWDSGDVLTGRNLLDAACKLICSLDSRAGEVALNMLLDLAETDRHQAIVRGVALLRLFVAALEATVADASPYAENTGLDRLAALSERFVAAMERWGVDPAVAQQVRLAEALSMLWKRAARAARSAEIVAAATERLAAQVDFSSVNSVVRSSVYASLYRAEIACLGPEPQAKVDKCRVSLYATASATFAGESGNAVAHASEVSRETKNSADRRVVLSHASAWTHVAWSHGSNKNAAACMVAADKVDAIAAPFARDREFELRRAQAWSRVAWSHGSNEDWAACMEAAGKVEAIAAPFACDPGFEYWRASAWTHVAWSHRSNKDSAACMEAAGKVEAIAASFAGDRDFELRRAEAWTQVVWSHGSNKNAAACMETAGKIEEIAAPFAGDRDFEYWRASAWTQVAWSHGSNKNAAACMETAGKVDAIAAPFARDREFELRRAEAWSHVAWSHGSTKNVAACLEAAGKVDAIAAAFAGDRNFEYWRASAWRYVSWAHHLNGDTEAFLEVEDRVKAIARPFSGDPAFEPFLVVDV